MNFDLKILNDRTPKTGDNGNVNNQQRSQQQPNGNEIDLDRIVRQFDERASIYEDAIALSNFTNTPNELATIGENYSPYCATDLKRVDFVLVYQKSTNDDANPLNHEMIRRKFEANLLSEGLALKHVPSSVGNNVNYVHIYAPYNVLARYAEVMALRMPMKTIKTSLKYLFGEEFEQDRVFTTVFTKEKEYLFNIPEHDKDEFFTPSQRGEIIDYILKRTRFKDSNDFFSIGIHKLLSDHVYQAAYPLHDASKQCENQNDCRSIRCYLLANWASLFCILKHQQVDKIVDYFGVKIAMYYAWVGFYTLMLIPAVGIGLLTFFYGILTLSSDQPTNDVCHKNFTAPMCPICAKNCDFVDISESCMPAKASYLMGNFTTVIFAIFISIWSTIYLEMWKRYSSKICFQWDLSDFSTIDEPPRTEYMAYLSKQKSTKTRINPVTRVEEPYISFVRGRLPYFIMSFSFVLLSVAVVLLIMVSIIVYRVSTYIALSTQHQYESEFLRQNIEWIVTSTAATINLILIMILSIVYKRLAKWLTEMELPRTQNEFDNSLTLKMYLFEFVNYYSSLFYIAFFKGTLAKTPPDGSLQTDKINKLIEPCPIGGCYFDLTIQLVIILLGKNLFSSMLEYLIPYLYGVYNRYVYFSGEKKSKSSNNPSHKLEQYEEDYLLESWDHSVLFYEYLELVLQFGFITLFVSAFPLAPFFALLNNIFEIRFDARKMLKNYKRPVAQRVKDIGVWYTILDALGKLSVFTNAVIIAFNTDIIPRMMYYYTNGNLKNFYASTLSNYVINSDDEVPDSDIKNCFYYGYRENDGSYSEQHWYVIIAKIVFVIVFQNVVTAINSFLKVVIPDEPGSLRLRKRQHAFITNELIIRHELQSHQQNFQEPNLN
ncbi:Anoctamin-1 [Dermatophagoides farinae]|uniref:Anoctamin n=1 Tax=Dermatophagoides farinae TaxID=6954 RepID=A0A922HUK8_DERFA|nr:anoctamin-4-like [Dermatophagoides farinae]KAH7640129.1 anoctamin-like protein [Dermatophagoides farinae]KAH9506734.1 Anoctamin-1 [Dermatophagoides farinae]